MTSRRLMYLDFDFFNDMKALKRYLNQGLKILLFGLDVSIVSPNVYGPCIFGEPQSNSIDSKIINQSGDGTKIELRIYR